MLPWRASGCGGLEIIVIHSLDDIQPLAARFFRGNAVLPSIFRRSRGCLAATSASGEGAEAQRQAFGGAGARFSGPRSDPRDLCGRGANVSTSRRSLHTQIARYPITHYGTQPKASWLPPRLLSLSRRVRGRSVESPVSIISSSAVRITETT